MADTSMIGLGAMASELAAALLANGYVGRITGNI